MQMTGRPARLKTTAAAGMRLIALACAAALALLAAAAPSQAASRLEFFLAKEQPKTFHPQAAAFGKPQGNPPVVPLLGSGGKTLGHIFLNADWVNATGYSGKPIEILVAVDPNGFITGVKLVHHAEPIVLVGIPESKIRNFIKGYVGKDAHALARAIAGNNRNVDIVSGATVTIMVIDDTIVHSAVKVAQALAGQAGTGAAAAPPLKIDPAQTAKQDWLTLLGDGSVRRLRLKVSEVNEAYEKAGHPAAKVPADEAKPGDTFIELYAALVSIPSVGRSLLGDAEYQNMLKRLKPGQQAVLVAGNGLYSFKGSGYVRGGIFDRIHLIQRDISVRFRDRQHTRLADVLAEGAPRFREVALFRIDPKSGFRADRPWRIQLLVSREMAPLQKAFLTFDLGYTAPRKYFLKPAPAKVAAAAKPAPAAAGPAATPLWKRLWQRKTVDIAILLAALGLLTAIFFFQNWVVLNAKRLDTIRVGFLIFTTFYLGFYAHAQLSVVNVLTFSNALLTGFKWEYFLTEPMTFILWCSVAGSLPFWGRGPYCGWLCPFGALQELTNRVAKLFKVPQLRLPWGLHERLWPLKYIIFMGILGLSLYSLALAERASEIEPFKTAIILHFVREWWYVLFAVALLVVGLFVERFFCRYLCPLGAALALPGRLRMFEWLRRYNECGSPCQTCAKQCMVQAIHPTGEINPNECLYCLHCQQVYYDDHLCPVMVERRQRRERRQARASKPEVIAAAVASNAGGKAKGCGAART
jgi:NosR/NirI family transcriptional regulator, nitrous oxide reductase regulator